MYAGVWFYGVKEKALPAVKAPDSFDAAARALLDRAYDLSTDRSGSLDRNERNTFAWVCNGIVWQALFPDDVGRLGIIEGLTGAGLANLQIEGASRWLAKYMRQPDGLLYGRFFDLRACPCCMMTEADREALDAADSELLAEEAQDPDAKALLYVFLERSLQVLVPKKRGVGFQKVPIGHHETSLSSLAYDIGYDMFGLDGSIHVETGYVALEKEEAVAKKVLEPISRLLRLPYREISRTEYWQLHPTKTSSDEEGGPQFYR